MSTKTSSLSPCRLVFCTSDARGPSAEAPSCSPPSVVQSYSPVLESVIPVHMDRVEEFFKIYPQEFLQSKIQAAFDTFRQTETTAKEFIDKNPKNLTFVKCRFATDKKVEILFYECFKEGGNKINYRLRHLTDTFPKGLGPKLVYGKVLPGRNKEETKIYKIYFSSEAHLTCAVSQESSMTIPYEIAYKTSKPDDIKGLLSPECLGNLYELNSLIPEDMPESQRRNLVSHLLLQVAAHLADLHDRLFVHGDLTPGNILISEVVAGQSCIPHASLIDFGQTERSGTQRRRFATAHGFAAPEQFSVPWIMDPSSDMWSFGMIVIECVWKVDVSGGLSEHERVMAKEMPMIRKVHAFKEKMLVMVRTPDRQDPFLPLLTRLLDNDPAKRPTAKEVVEILKAIVKLYE